MRLVLIFAFQMCLCHFMELELLLQPTVWVSGLPLRHLTRFYLALFSSSDSYFILLSKPPSLTRKRVCSLQCNRSLVRLLTPNNHTLPSHLRLCSLSAASYDSQGLRWRYSNPPSHGSVTSWFATGSFCFSRSQTCPMAILSPPPHLVL
jgi:hypothetical protein